MERSYRIFDRTLVRRRHGRVPENEDILYLFREGAEGLAERLCDINRDFHALLAVGPLASGKLLKNPPKSVVRADLSGAASTSPGETPVVLDEEEIPFKAKTFDLVLSNLTLHWVNDLPGALLQIREVLREDGLLLACLLGGETLRELRESLLYAEAETSGGASPRISPFANVRDAGDLLTRAGFAMPVADVETLTVSYQHPLVLMRELKAMGENNALFDRLKTFSRKDTLKKAAEYYIKNFSDEEGRIFATFQFIYLTGWAPGPNQPKPLKPGSAKASLADALKP
jgi:SAM-dependent methyltransferase